VGIVGGNGAGKSTLFRMIMGLDTPDGGSLDVGDTVVPMYVDQSRDALDPDKSVRHGLVLVGVGVGAGVGGEIIWEGAWQWEAVGSSCCRVWWFLACGWGCGGLGWARGVHVCLRGGGQ
jgi:energy-coupling factor transporter ATP-binding protein EcfA2